MGIYGYGFIYICIDVYHMWVDGSCDRSHLRTDYHLPHLLQSIWHSFLCSPPLVSLSRIKFKLFLLHFRTLHRSNCAYIWALLSRYSHFTPPPSFCQWILLPSLLSDFLPLTRGTPFCPRMQTNLTLYSNLSVNLLSSPKPTRVNTSGRNAVPHLSKLLFLI